MSISPLPLQVKPWEDHFSGLWCSSELHPQADPSTLSAPAPNNGKASVFPRGWTLGPGPVSMHKSEPTWQSVSHPHQGDCPLTARKRRSAEGQALQVEALGKEGCSCPRDLGCCPLIGKAARAQDCPGDHSFSACVPCMCPATWGTGHR